MKNWNEKVKAVLHDPPYKFLDIKGHTAGLNSLYETMGLTTLKASGDVLASSMDRFLFPDERKKCQYGRICLNFIGENAVWKHTLGKTQEVIKPFDTFSEMKSTEMAQALREKFMKDMIEPIKDLKNPQNTLDYKRMFLKLWWDLPAWIKNNIRTELIPADTRIPNHSITDHLFATSALSGIKEKAFVFFSIGPVQSFISSARKTTDLWAGSYLLSDLSMECMLTVADEFGPDSVIFPDLHGQAKVKKWLQAQNVPLYDEETLDEYLPSVPNRFIALVEYSEAKKMTELVERKLNEKWKDISSQAKEYFKQKGWLKNEDLWDKQIATFPEFYSVTFKWPKDLEEVKQKFSEFFGEKIEETQEYKIMIKTLEHISKNSTTYSLNIGPYYGVFFEMARRLLDSRKMTTNIPPYIGKDGIDKDTISGSFEWVLKYPSIEKDDAEEKLNAIDAVKRYCADEKYKELLNDFTFSGHTVSTTDIALGKLLSQKRDIKEDGAKIAVLMMDGDHMGWWISGKKAPNWKDAFSENTLKHETFKKYIKEDFLNSKRPIYPAYHRAISKALSTFTKYVGIAVKNHGGLLVYAGGDDVLAFLPASEVFECANEIRKMFSGKLFTLKTKDKNGKEKVVAEFKNGFVYENGVPIAQLMGIDSSMSAGIAVGHHKYPLSELLEYAHKGEKRAKENERDGFCLYTIRRSGQISTSQSKWEDGNDVIELAEDILSYVAKDEKSEKLEISPKLIKTLIERHLYQNEEKYKYSMTPELKLIYEKTDDLKLYLKNLIKRRLLLAKDKKLAEKLTETLSEKLFVFLTNKDKNDDFMIQRTNLLNEMLFAKRGDKS